MKCVNRRWALVIGIVVASMQSASGQAGLAPKYAHTIEGLTEQISDIMEAQGRGDAAQLDALLQNLLLRDPSAWIAEHFPPDKTSDLLTKYEKFSSRFVGQFRATISRNSPTNGGSFQVTADTSEYQQRPLDVEPVKPVDAESYQVHFSPGKTNAATFFITFTFADGRYRYVGDRSSGFWQGPAPTMALPVLLHKASPNYPARLKNSGIGGAVVLNALIGKDGHIESIKVVSGDPELAAAAAKAVKKWRYKPATLKGEPVSIYQKVTINFQP